jgi:hypothetical protein
MARRSIMVLGAVLLALSGGAALNAAEIRSDFDVPVAESGGNIRFGPLNFDPHKNPRGMVERLEGAGPGGANAVRLSVDPARPLTVEQSDDGLKNDRAELRELDDLQMPYGTPVWYGFSFRISADAPDSDGRLVIAQIKTPARPGLDPSPMFSLRHRQGKLSATLEHVMVRDPAKTLRPVQQGSCPGGGYPMEINAMNSPSRHGAPRFEGRVLVAPQLSELPPISQARYTHCDTFSLVTRGMPIEDVRGRWVKVALFIKAGPRRDGEIELYVDGKLAGSARGRLGELYSRKFNEAQGKRTTQYFKLGIYRDKADFPLAIDYARFRRGATREAVEAP